MFSSTPSTVHLASSRCYEMMEGRKAEGKAEKKRRKERKMS